MLGLNDFVIIIVVNALSDDEKRPTDFRDQTATVRLASIKTMSQDTIGNVHERSNIQKQAYPSESVKTIKQAYGITGTNFETHTPFRNGKQLQLNDGVSKNQEITLIRNGLNTKYAIITANVHRVIPERTGS
tara:strand:+ start:26741 stop:27136 length:396 start_codon:yes stop_codon:yes gene_type:complete